MPLEVPFWKVIVNALKSWDSRTVKSAVLLVVTLVGYFGYTLMEPEEVSIFSDQVVAGATALAAIISQLAVIYFRVNRRS